MKRILVVDDDRTLRLILKRYLEKNGYVVQEAGSGVEGLASFDREPPDLIVSDIIMPRMDGFEFCRNLRASRSGQLVPFIFLSTKGELNYRVEGHQIGADDYLTKPFAPQELLAKIESQIERSRRIEAEIRRLIQQRGGSVILEELPPEPPAVLPIAEPVHTSPEAQPEPLPLTPAETRVFWEVIQGHTNKQIAQSLFISPRTVQTHLSHILSKLELDNRAQLVRFAFENGYQPPDRDSSKEAGSEHFELTSSHDS